MMIELNKIGPQVIEIVKIAGQFILKQRNVFSIDIAESKGLHDFVSYVDRESELQLVKALSALIPESGFIAEENTAYHANEEYLWIIDPLDGTTNFMHGVAPFSISIALQQNNKTILGVVYELGQQEMFYSWEGSGVFCNEKPIKVSSSKCINDSLISTGFPVNDFSRLEKHLKVVGEIVRGSHGLRRHGSAATDLAYVAAGRIDGFFEYGLSVWDLAAGAYLIEKAGGRVSDYKGEADYFFGRELCAGTLEVHTELVNLLSKQMF